jgi:predicted  nucleic acid-binding Zn-ribbon protein
MSNAFGLLRLQQVDSRITLTETRLRDIQTIMESDEELEAGRSQVLQAERDWKHAEDRGRAADNDAAAQRAKIEQAEASLYSGKVTNPKELQDLQADVSSLKKQLSVIENRELEALESIEASEVAARVARGKLEQITARRSNEFRELTAERTGLEGTLENLRAEREAAAGALDKSDLKAYDALRANHAGIAVTEVVDGACSACGTMLTAAQQQTVRHSQNLVNCPTCGRILYAG